MIELRTHESLRDIGERDWSSLAGEDTPPFLSWTFLDALERTGCVRPERGWYPCHVSLRKDGELVAASPAYVKSNSEGEFVFDHGWAQFAEGRLGVPYYPKLVVAVPFTPVTGPRLLVRPGTAAPELLRALAEGLAQLARRLDVSSAHVLFPTEAEAGALARAGLVERFGVQYHWHNAGYSTFDDFLSRFNSKRRNQIRREVRALGEQGLDVRVLSGKELTPEVVDAVFDFYSSTVEKHFWGRQYLNRAFFEEVCSKMGDSVLVVLARDSSGKALAGAFNLLGRRALFGRYWGVRAGEERPFLHFNLCYYRGIAECIERGLDVFEPGAGGEHKLARGFEPAVTRSVHHLVDPRLDHAIRDFLARERDAVRAHLDEYAEGPILKRGSSGGAAR